MIHAALSLLFIFVASKWLQFELGRKNVNFRQNWPWVGGAVGFQLLASLLSILVGGKSGNLILHSVGGGVAATLLFFYLVKTFNFRLNWRLQLVVLFMFVSTLGVLNELAEYAAELANVDIFSLDTHDVWRDFTANTSGMLIAWAVIKLYFLAKK